MGDFDNVLALLSASPGARFWKADLHVHTPASSDMGARWKSASPKQVVDFALAAELDVIAITDHNTVDWCDRVREAASGTNLHVLPGTEISTKHGHLLAIFDEEIKVEKIKEFLIGAGFTGERYGSLDAASAVDMNILAEQVDQMGGVAIAAHVDNKNGLMTFPVGDEKRRVSSSPFIRAFEITNATRRSDYEGGHVSSIDRKVPCVMASDCSSATSSTHELDAIGSRFTSFKMEAVSAYGIKQALLDPAIRVRFAEEPTIEPQNTIEGLWVAGGFLDGQLLRFSDNLTCMIGDTGTGKSFALELVRSALRQQASIDKISSEISSLLKACLTGLSKVNLIVSRGDFRYLIEQTFDDGIGGEPSVKRITESGLEDLETAVDLPTFFPIKAYSQSEILEFARQPESRLSLTDDLIDIRDETSLVEAKKADLRTNASELIEARRRLADALERIDELGTIQEQIRRFSELLDHPRVAVHRLWISERGTLDTAKNDLTTLRQSAVASFPAVAVNLLSPLSKATPNADLLTEASKVGEHLRTGAEGAKLDLLQQIDEAREKLAEIRGQWDDRFSQEQSEYNDLLRSIDTDGVGLPALSRKLESLEAKESDLLKLKSQIDTALEPAINNFNSQREGLLDELQNLRREITRKRTEKARQLTQALGRRIVVDVDSDANSRQFQDALTEIRVGSRVPDTAIAGMAKELHPVPFVKSLLEQDYDQLEQVSEVKAALFGRLYDNLIDRRLMKELYDLQIVNVDDVVRIRFAVSEGEYRDLEMLAHGQKCTVVLAVAMAEGEFPLIVDQPEDALHAPYIEDNIVRTLRDHRGHRQCIFATRNANVLVSGDAEQVIVMEADSNTGRVKRTGSIDQFDTRDLILLHLEGGRTAFERKQLKYGIDAG